MKILHFLIGRCNPDSANGVEKTVANLVRELAEMPSNKVFLFSLTEKDIIPIGKVEIFKFSPTKIPFLFLHRLISF
jgi:hypothetical protein